MRTLIKHALIAAEPKDTITVKGWVRTRRDSKGFSFLELNDGSCLANVQVIVDAGTPGYDQIAQFTTGASAVVEGKLVASPAQGQKWELRASRIELVGTADAAYPLQKKGHTLEFLRTIAHLRPRSNLFGAVFRTRSRLAFAVHDFFQRRDFVYVHTPIITASDCEGAGEMFRVTTLPLTRPSATLAPKEGRGEVSSNPDSLLKPPDEAERRSPDRLAGQPDRIRADQEIGAPVRGEGAADFFGKPSYLTVSGQLEAETFACALSNVYTFGPTFRAENSNTARHAAEFWMIEPEMAFCDLQGDMDLGEEFIKAMATYTMEHCAEDLAMFTKFVDKGLTERLKFVVERPFVRVPYTEAVEILQKSGRQFEYAVEYGQNLQSEHERFLTEEHFKSPTTVFNYPREIKPFYMRLNDDQKTVTAMDVLVPGIGEVIGGAQREERLEQLRDNLKFHKLNEADYWWYTDLRKYGTVPHAGFGLGFERLLMFLTGVSNIRDVIPFARTPGNAEF